jgi:hypothetical protein
MVTGERPSELSVGLRMPAAQAVGLPFFVEVTLANQTEAAEYYDLMPCDPLSPPFPIEFTFTMGTDRVVLPARSSASPAARSRGFDLSPGEARTFVVDLSELEPALPDGAWQCQARWVMRHESPRSAPAPITLTSVAAAERPLLARLRSSGGAQSPSWSNFIEAPDALEQGDTLQGLSEEARRALVPYLILHQAIHGPEALAVFPPDFLAQYIQGPWASEASVLAYELLWSRRAPDLPQQRAGLLQRWPGLGFRVAEIEAGAGLLTRLRRDYGPKGGGG